MAYTDHTWVGGAGNPVTVSDMNAYIRDALRAIVAGNTTSSSLSGNLNPIANVTDVTGATLVTNGGPVVMMRSGGQIANSSGITQGPVFLSPCVDGAISAIPTPVIPNEADTLANSITSWMLGASVVITGYSAGTHTFSWRDNIGDGTSAWQYQGGVQALRTMVIEVGF